MTAATRGSASPYVFNNDKPTAGGLLDALSQMLDPFTHIRLTQAGLSAGSRCLEIGAGRGSIAAWMADQVGPSGEVIATDVKPQHVTPHEGVTVIEHNITVDELPEGDFDIIHARAVLQHLPERREVLAKLTAALRPGGAVVIEELESRWSTSVLAAADERAPEVYAKYEKALETVLRNAGNDPTWNRQVLKAMRDVGLREVNTEAWQRSFEGGTGICQLAYSGSTELQDKLVATGHITAGDLEILRAVAIDPSTVLRGMLLVSTTGYKA
jgi:2-polyprenyl-3-methyl-5-hydroxy-6-metoxy-1,4-benzoquinol methylase